MPKLLLVEGDTDAVFFQWVLQRLYGATLQDARDVTATGPAIRVLAIESGLPGAPFEVEIRSLRGRGNIAQVVRAQLSTGILEFAVAPDLDLRTPAEIRQSISQMATSASTGGPHSPNITVIPVGLPGDSALAELGIVQHTVEDYLIRLMLEDLNLRGDTPQLSTLLLEILPAVRRHHTGPFDSSKDLFQLIKPVVQHGFSDTGVVQKLVRDADDTILRSVLGTLLVDTESALNT